MINWRGGSKEEISFINLNSPCKTQIENDFDFADKKTWDFKYFLDFNEWREMVKKCYHCIKKIDLVEDLMVGVINWLID